MVIFFNALLAGAGAFTGVLLVGFLFLTIMSIRDKGQP